MSNQAGTSTSAQAHSGDTSGESSTTLTPASTPNSSSQRTGSVRFDLKDLNSKPSMESESKDQEAGASDRQDREDTPAAATETKTDKSDTTPKATKKKSKCAKHSHDKAKQKKKSSRSKKARSENPTSEDSSSDDSASESDSSDSSSESEVATKKKNKKKAGKSAKAKGKKGKRKGKKSVASSSEDSEPEDVSEEETEEDDEAADPDPASTSGSVAQLEQQLAALKRQMLISQMIARSKKPKTASKTTKAKQKITKAGVSTKFKRVDRIWDSTIHNYKLKESAEEDDSVFAEYAFLVRRLFNWENKYHDTVVDIKSKQLRAALLEVMKDCKSVGLEAEEPEVDPKMLFIYLEEFRTYYKKTLKSKIKAERKSKVVKKLEQQRQLVKALVSYLDEDFADTKKTLYPLLEAGKITFDLCWALFHPNEIAVTSCYGNWEEPRCFKVEYTSKYTTMTRGEWYCIEGKYLEYDGKGFGYGDFEVDIESFQGPRKITSLSTYPLKYHADPEGVKKQIVERGEKFISLEGMHYKFHKGMAFHKKKKQVLKININGRVMLDPATFRRVNANYPISWIKPKDDDELFNLDGSDSEDDNSCCCGSDSDEETLSSAKGLEKRSGDGGETKPQYRYKWTQNSKGNNIFVRVEVDADGDPIHREKLADKIIEAGDFKNHSFTKDELLLTSPVILGFAFSEKLWLEFTISGIHSIVYNDSAFDSLVLPPNQKSIVRALVESHKSHGAKTIDDVVQGKGKGLVAVLHGPPGTGKTLTAEGISELLRVPLYMVSAGELGTDPGRLEAQLQQILDIAHSWGAVLLLDEADVFLEKREVHDIHRNALVSIFLRLLEYFQGILFLTTNRVETFDDAFQSRIHVALRYGELTHKAKKTVWRMFIDLVRKVEGMEVGEIAEAELEALARRQLNGRQIKNLVRTAQALALNEKTELTMEHIRRVLDVAETFERDLKGGTGYIDAMRSYT